MCTQVKGTAKKTKSKWFELHIKVLRETLNSAQQRMGKINAARRQSCRRFSSRIRQRKGSNKVIPSYKKTKKKETNRDGQRSILWNQMCENIPTALPTTIKMSAESPPNLKRRGLCSARIRRRRLRRVPLARAVPPLAADATPLPLSLSPFHFL